MPQLLQAVDARFAAAGLATHSAPSAAKTMPKTLEELEREHILRVLDDSEGKPGTRRGNTRHFVAHTLSQTARV